MNNKSLGQIGELAARKIYWKNGFQILETNYFNKKGKSFGEIDFVAVKDKILHFVEVKTRKGFLFGDAVEAVNPSKLRKLTKVIKYYLVKRPAYQDFKCQIDVVTVQVSLFDNSVQKIKIYSDVIVDYY